MNKEFEYFKKRVKYWQKFFGLYDWEISVHLDEEDDDNDLAYTTFVVDNKRADIFLCADWDTVEMTDYELDKTAFHETVEILLLEVRYLAGKRTYSYDDMDRAIHSVIRTLTAKIFEKEIISE